MTRRLTSTLGMLAIAALLGGCASLSEEECRNADWGRLGHQDGAAGYPESRLAEHAEACAKIGIRPMGDIWRAGWDRGVLLYCMPSVGWREGLAGHGYSGVCRGRNEEAFLQAYRAGAEIHACSRASTAPTRSCNACKASCAPRRTTKPATASATACATSTASWATCA